MKRLTDFTYCFAVSPLLHFILNRIRAEKPKLMRANIYVYVSGIVSFRRCVPTRISSLCSERALMCRHVHLINQTKCVR